MNHSIIDFEFGDECMPDDYSHRVTELEMQLSHTQREVEQLNEVLTEQSRQLDRVMRLVTRFEEKLDDF